MFFGALMAWKLSRNFFQEQEPPPSARQKTRRPFCDVKLVGGMVPFSLQLMSTDFLILLNGYVSIAILRWLTNDFDQVGFFARGIQLATLTTMAFQSVNHLMYANWSNRDGTDRQKSVERTVNVVFTVVVALCVIVLIAAEPLTVILYGSEFKQSAALARIAIFGVGAFVVARLLQNLFNAAGHGAYGVAMMLTGLAITTTAGLLLVPQHGAYGSATAVLISALGMTTFALVVARRRFDIRLASLLIPSPRLLVQAARSAFAGSGGPRPIS